MKHTVVIAASSDKAARLERVLRSSFETVVFDEISSLTSNIINVGGKTAAIVVSADFLVDRRVSKALKKADPNGFIPLLALGTAGELEALAGVERISDFICEPLSEAIAIRRVRNAVRSGKAKKDAARRRIRMESEIQGCVSSLIEGIVGRRNQKCGEHTHCVQLFTVVIANDVMKHCPKYGLTKETVEMIASASKMHDIGKVAVKDSILFKPERLSDEEYAQMKLHPVIGAELFEKMRPLFGKEYAEICHDIILYHHERYDGGGYPAGLAGDNIPIAAQIVALADVYDALVANRVYKKNIEPAQAVEMILRGDCGVFSDEMLRCLLRTNKKLAALSRREFENR